MMNSTKFLTTKQLSKITGLSKSFFDKGRIYNYGPPFIRVSSSGKGTGKILYIQEEAERWLVSRQHNPEGRV